MADSKSRAPGKRANARVGEDWRSEERVAAGEAAAAGAAGRPSCCGWRMAMAGCSGSERTLGLEGWRSEKQVAASWGSGGSGGCGKAELLWMMAMADEERAAAVEAAGAAGGPSC